MKAIELRKGNYVNWDDEFVNGMTTNSIHQFDIGLIHKITPIPLTEEWLKKLGSRYVATDESLFWIPVSNLKAELHFEIYPNTDEIVTILKSDFGEIIFDRVFFVHELQNLYYALTKEELVLAVTPINTKTNDC